MYIQRKYIVVIIVALTKACYGAQLRSEKLEVFGTHKRMLGNLDVLISKSVLECFNLYMTHRDSLSFSYHAGERACVLSGYYPDGSYENMEDAQGWRIYVSDSPRNDCVLANAITTDDRVVDGRTFSHYRTKTNWTADFGSLCTICAVELFINDKTSFAGMTNIKFTVSVSGVELPVSSAVHNYHGSIHLTKYIYVPNTSVTGKQLKIQTETGKPLYIHELKLIF